MQSVKLISLPRLIQHYCFPLPIFCLKGSILEMNASTCILIIKVDLKSPYQYVFN